MGASLFQEECSFFPTLSTDSNSSQSCGSIPQSPDGEDAPFVTIGPFAGMDTLFHGTAGDLDLYMAEEVVTLKNTGVFKSSITELPTATPPSLTSLGQVVPSPLSSKLQTAIPRWNQTPLPEVRPANSF